MLAAPIQCKSEKLNLISAAYKADMSPSATRLLHLMLDVAGAVAWTSPCLAKAIKRSVRTVDRALAELRAIGVLRTVRGRRRAMVKVLNHVAIHRIGVIGAAASRKAWETREKVALWVKTRQKSRAISVKDISRALDHVRSIAKVEKSDASASLLRSRLARPG